MYTQASSPLTPGRRRGLLLAVCCACLCATAAAQHPPGEGSEVHPASWDYFSQPERDLHRAAGYTPPPPSEATAYAPAPDIANETRVDAQALYLPLPIDVSLPGGAPYHNRAELERYGATGESHRMLVDEIRRTITRKAKAPARDSAVVAAGPPEDPR